MRRASLASAIRNSQTILNGGKAIFVSIFIEENCFRSFNIVD
jgi:hypothetical protein